MTTRDKQMQVIHHVIMNRSHLIRNAFFYSDYKKRNREKKSRDPINVTHRRNRCLDILHLFDSN